MNQIDTLNKVAEVFEMVGGKFYASLERITDALTNIRGFIFDWDGVFHSGHKGERYGGVFSETDSMGINLLRYGYWLENNKHPYMAIITGESNEIAIKFAEREHFNAIYRNIRDKKEAIDHICRTANMQPNQIACVFDDVNDLSMSRLCGLRIQVARRASPLLMNYTADNSLCDYVTGHCAEEHAVREVCELFLGLLGVYDQVVASRVSFDERYRHYWQARNTVPTSSYTIVDNEIAQVEGK